MSATINIQQVLTRIERCIEDAALLFEQRKTAGGHATLIIARTLTRTALDALNKITVE